MKFDLSKYYEPTPKNIRKFADAWALFWAGLLANNVVHDKPVWAITCLVLMLLGKAVSNFFTDDNNAN